MRAFLRTTKKLTFRKRAMKLLHAGRHYYHHEMDEQDRYFQDRRGSDELQVEHINPHRVQLFSMNEIWKCIKDRLIQINIIRKPEEDFGEQSDASSDAEPDDLTLKDLAKRRLPNLFGNRSSMERHLTGVANLLKPNDLRLVKEVIWKTAINAETIDKLAKSVKDTHAKTKEKMDWLVEQENYRGDLLTEIRNTLKDLGTKLRKTQKELVQFRDKQFPDKLDEFLSKSGAEILKNIKNV